MNIPELLRSAAAMEGDQSPYFANKFRAAADELEQQEPVAWCLTDVNGKPAELVYGPGITENPQDKRIVTPLYRHPSPVAPAVPRTDGPLYMITAPMKDGPGEMFVEIETADGKSVCMRSEPVEGGKYRRTGPLYAASTVFINYPEDGIPDDAETAYREGYIAGWSAASPRVGQGMAAVPEGCRVLLQRIVDELDTIDESAGIYGRYRNGDIAAWGERDLAALYDEAEKLLSASPEPATRQEMVDFDTLTEPGYYWWLPKFLENEAHKPESWQLVNWHPENGRSMVGWAVGPLKPPIATRQEALDELTRLGHEMGDYDADGGEMRRDAERYNAIKRIPGLMMSLALTESLDAWDEAIDAAMKGEQ